MQIENNKNYEIKQAPTKMKKFNGTLPTSGNTATTVGDGKVSSQAHSAWFRAHLKMNNRINYLLSLKSKEQVFEDLKNCGFTAEELENLNGRDIEALNKLDDLFSLKAYTHDNKLKPVIQPWKECREFFTNPECDLDSALDLAKMTYTDEKGRVKGRFDGYEVEKLLRYGIDTKSQTFKDLANITRNDANFFTTHCLYGDECDKLPRNDKFYSEHSKIRHTAPRFSIVDIRDLMKSNIDTNSDRFKQFINTTIDINGEQRPYFDAFSIERFFHSDADVENLKKVKSLIWHTEKGDDLPMFDYFPRAEKLAKTKDLDTLIELANLRDNTKPNNPSVFYGYELGEFVDKGYNLRVVLDMAKDSDLSNYYSTDISKSVIIDRAMKDFMPKDKELKQVLDFVDDEKFKTMLEDFYNKSPHKNIDELLRYVDVYNNLNGNYTTIKKEYGVKPYYREYLKYCKDNNININNSRYADFVQDQYIGQLVDLCKNNKSELTEYLYNDYVGFGHDSTNITKQLREINQKYGVKVFLPADERGSEECLNEIEQELETWTKASSGKAKMPPVIDLQTAKQDYIDDTSAYGSGRTAGLCETQASKAISLDGHESMGSLRHEMTHANDEKGLWEFPKNWDGKSKFWNEFKKGGIPEYRIDYAFNNPMEFIARAMEGDLQRYSEEFIKQLHEFGLPKWATKISKLAR